MMLAAILALSVTASDAIYAVRGWVRQGGTLEAVGMPMEAVVQTTDAGNRFYAVRYGFCADHRVHAVGRGSNGNGQAGSGVGAAHGERGRGDV